MGGKPSDLKEATQLIAAGATLEEVARQHPSAFVRNYKGLGVLQGLLKPVGRAWRGPRTVWYLQGATGCGKTRAAFEHDPDLYEPLCPGRGQVWWDGYRRQKTILFDDIRSDRVSFADALRWTDGRPFTSGVKGGTADVDADTWIFTSNDPPAQVWPGVDLAPLERRLTVWVRFNPNGTKTNIKGQLPPSPPPPPPGVAEDPVSHVTGVEPGNTPAGSTSPDLFEGDQDDYNARFLEGMPTIHQDGSNPPGFPLHWADSQ